MDEQIKNIALNLSLGDLFKYCLTNKKINDIICKNEKFWETKLNKDFPDIKKLNLYGNSFLEIYKNLSRKIEIYLNVKIIQKYYEDDEEVIKEKDFEKLLKFPKTTDIKEINNEIENIAEKISTKGVYDVFIDGNYVCKKVKSLNECIQINDDTSEVLIFINI
jgi:predicted Rdx family selenoprotein